MSFWREASSVILLTKSSSVKNVGQDPFKILCIKRSKIISFLPNYTVFPGGVTDKSDSSPEWTNIIPDHLNPSLNLNIVGYNGNPAMKLVPDNESGCIPKSLSLRITAIRETFEECGILLCKKVNNGKVDTCATANHLDIDSINMWRKLVQKNAYNFINLCVQNNCYPDVGVLYLWSNWLTPPLLKIHFDTKFFLTVIETPVDSSPDGIEISEISWFTSNEIMSRFVAGYEKLSTPQYYELLRLKQFKCIEHLLHFSCARSVEGCEQMLPMIIATKDGILSLLPGDGKYNTKNLAEVHYELDKHVQYFDSHVMHRLHYTDKNLLPKKLIITNYTPKYGHILPLTQQNFKI